MKVQKPEATVSLRDVRAAVQCAIENEQITRARVEAVEDALLEVSKKAREEIDALKAHTTMTRWQRLRWVLGR